MGEVVLNQHGQKMGRKGLVTRRRIMDKTLDLLKNSSYKDLTVAEVAYEAGVSSSSFYVYFSDIEDVLFACVENAAQDMSSIMELVEEEWPPENLRRQVARFVESYLKLWERHQVELRVRNLEADQGNRRFYDFRIKSTEGLIVALSQKFSIAHPGFKNNMGLATVFITSIERIAAAHMIGFSGKVKLTRKKLSDALVDTLYLMISGEL
ncbi:MAG: TetR/AcrR family transcriptional regulator [Pseudomonadales bacterium]|nr:MAG: TetR/AcrR family transcriptional regulator [Pseudomonadales bacterium]